MNKETLITTLTTHLEDTAQTVHTLERELAALELPEDIKNETGRLRTKRNNSYTQYFLRSGQGSDGLKWISPKQGEYLQQLALKQYYDELLLAAMENCSKSRELLRVAEQVEDLSEISGKFLSKYPFAEVASKVPDEGYRAWWFASRTSHNPYRSEEKIYPTHDGAMVRSKSEQSIYNELLDYGVPFQYELELRIGSQIYYPDFTLLDVPGRREVYFEHYGFMNNESYRAHYYQKVEHFQSLGLTLNQDYFCTFEDAGYPFDIRKVQRFLSTRFPQ